MRTFFYRFFTLTSLVALTQLATTGCKNPNGNSDTASGVSNSQRPYLQAAKKYEAVSNFICRVPFFTQSYEDAVASVSPPEISSVVSSLRTTGRDFLSADLAVTALAEFEGTSALTHAQAVTRALHLVEQKVSSTEILAAIHRLPLTARTFLSSVKVSMALSSDADAYRMLLFKLKSVQYAQHFLGAMATQIRLPIWLSTTTAHMSSAAAQTLNVLGFLGLFCSLANTASAGFEALAATEEANESKEQAATLESDACARINSNPRTAGKLEGCNSSGIVSRFTQGHHPSCPNLRVAKTVSGGAPIFARYNGTYQVFRVHAGMKLTFASDSNNRSISTTPKGHILTKIQVTDSAAANHGGVGWTYVAALDCQ